MGLSRALVDRARRVSAVEDPTKPWREGQPLGAEDAGPFLRVRFRPTEKSEQDGDGGKTFVRETGRLLIGLAYEDGSSLMNEDHGGFEAFDVDDMLEIESRELGTGRWHVSSRVLPMRRRKSLVGWRCDIRRAREATVQEGRISADVDTDVLAEVEGDWTAEVG